MCNCHLQIAWEPETELKNRNGLAKLLTDKAHRRQSDQAIAYRVGVEQRKSRELAAVEANASAKADAAMREKEVHLRALRDELELVCSRSRLNSWTPSVPAAMQMLSDIH